MPPRRYTQTVSEASGGAVVDERWRPQVSPYLARAVHLAPVLEAVAVHWVPGTRAEPAVPAWAWWRPQKPLRRAALVHATPEDLLVAEHVCWEGSGAGPRHGRMLETDRVRMEPPMETSYMPCPRAATTGPGPSHRGM